LIPLRVSKMSMAKARTRWTDSMKKDTKAGSEWIHRA
jgi:hypothetical protein